MKCWNILKNINWWSKGKHAKCWKCYEWQWWWIHLQCFQPILQRKLNYVIIYNSTNSTTKWSCKTYNFKLSRMCKEYATTIQIKWFFWGKSSSNNYLCQNLFFVMAMDGKTPKKVWIGNKPSLFHSWIFGGDAYVHIPKEKQNKFDFKKWNMHC